jgi:hypothetical protein
MGVLSVALVGCSFDGDLRLDGPPAIVDGAQLDGLPGSCQTEGEFACDGRNRLECGPDHQWLPDPVVCDFTCVGGACVDASNVAAPDVATCGPTAPRLAPTAGSVTITAPSGMIRLTCSDGCGDGLDEIPATRIAGSPGLGWFCLRSLDLPAGVSMGIPASGGPAEAIAFVVDGAVTIAGNVGLDGGNATGGGTGEGAPGADDGGGAAADFGGQGNPGPGACGGSGGASTGSTNDYAAGGGGGGGHAQLGGGGGGGRSPGGGTAVGGPGGSPCGEPALEPLRGGGGGGGGGDGSCGTACGWPGGGGGGAIQISSRVSIAIGGTARARGGDGHGVASGGGSQGGAGGGGGGGAILLEAPVISVTGSIVVDGGNGGSSGAGSGGAGASGATGPSSGATADGNSEGGAGGGGAGGRVRIRAAAPTCSIDVSPAAACSTASL